MRKLYDSCPEIKAIHITFPEDMGQQMGYLISEPQPEDGRWMERAIYGKPDFTVFSGLEELTLDNLFEEVPWWRSQIVQVLKKSPGMRRLRLSLAANTLFRYQNIENQLQFYNFFDKLCVEYGVVASPLHLRHLHLGNAVLPFKLGRIQRLTDMSSLKDVHLENRTLHSDICGRHGVHHLYNDPNDRLLDNTDEDDENYPYIYDGYRDVAFEVFGPVNCPNLRRLTVGTYDGDLDGVLRAAADPLWTRRLALSCVSTGYDQQQPAALLLESPALPLRMLEIDLNGYYNDSFCSIHQRDCPSLGRARGSRSQSPAEQILDRLAQEGHGTLEGLAVRLLGDLTHDNSGRFGCPFWAAPTT